VSNSLGVRETEIPGLFVVNLVLHGDERGWFKENYQRAKMEGLGLPRFDIVQNNFSYNLEKGASRGLHAEPWEKFVSLANGRAFAAWVDIRKGPSFGKSFSIEITPEIAVFVPRGVANGYQTLDEKVTYTYLVNAHWSPEVKYNAVNMFDPDLGFNWPIPEGEAIVSEKDNVNPMLKDVTPLEF
jgi:dTDP-4-dehydrorhamnose 3,5-epimerase